MKVFFKYRKVWLVFAQKPQYYKYKINTYINNQIFAFNHSILYYQDLCTSITILVTFL